MDIRLVCGRRLLELSKLEEHRLHAYENAKIYKDKVKYWHDNHLIPKQFEMGKKVLLYNSRLRLFLGKLKSRWSGPFEITQVFPYGAVEVVNARNERFKINEQRLKLYWAGGNHSQRTHMSFGWLFFNLKILPFWVEPTTINKSACWEATQY